MSWLPVYNGPGPTKVGGLGDSIMAMTNDELQNNYFSRAPYQWAVACYPGLKAQDIYNARWPQDLAGSGARHVVIIAGTNDCFVQDSAWNGLGILGLQNQIISCFSPATQIHWVKPYANPPIPPAGCDLQGHIAGFNNGLAYWAGQKSNLHLVDWPSCVYYFTASGVLMLQSDGVHPTQEGQNLLAYIIDQSV